MGKNPTSNTPATAGVDLNFAEPPARRGGRGRPSKYLPILEALRAHPDKNIILAENVTNTSIASAIKNGTMNGVVKGEYTPVSRVSGEVDGKKRFTIFVKFNGPVADETEVPADAES